MNRRNLLLLLPAIVLILSGVLFFSERLFPPPPEKITIADGQIPSFALVYIAEANGYFTDEGLDVTFRKFTLGREALEDVIAGNSQLATVYETPVVRKVYEGADLSVVTSLHKSTTASGLIGLKENGIDSASDLVGKRIGYTRFINTEFFLRSLLTINGIAEDEVTLVDLSTREIRESLKDGSIDAGVLYNPHLYEVKSSLGDSAVVITSNTYTENSMLTAKRDYAEQNTKTLEKVLRALVRAEQFAREQREESIDIVSEAIPGTNRQTLSETWDDMLLTLRLDNSMLTIFRREAQFFRDEGIYSEPLPDFEKLIFRQPLQKVKPEGVTIF